MYIGKTCVLFIRATFLHLLLMWEGWETNRAKVSSNHILRTAAATRATVAGMFPKLEGVSAKVRETAVLCVGLPHVHPSLPCIPLTV